MILNNIEIEKLDFSKIVLTDGCFDPIHSGHIDYFKNAKKRFPNFFHLCSVSSDKYLKKKHKPLIKDRERVLILNSIKFIDYVYLNKGSTKEFLEKYVPKVFFKGKDWQNKLPNEEVEICLKKNISIYFNSKNLNSSSKILKDYINFN